jgi:hypothetical protein
MSYVIFNLIPASTFVIEGWFNSIASPILRELLFELILRFTISMSGT